MAGYASFNYEKTMKHQSEKPWFMWTENKLSLLDRIKILFGWKIYTRFDAPIGQCSAGCDLRHQITRDKYDGVRWHNAGGMARELAAQDSDNSNDING